MANESPLSYKRFNRFVDEGLEMYRSLLRQHFDDLLADGAPPFQVPVSPERQLDVLERQRQSGSPSFWSRPDAQEAYEKLLRQLGRERAPYGGPLGTNPPGAPGIGRYT